MICEWNRCSRRQDVMDQQQKREMFETDQGKIYEEVKVFDLEVLRSQIYKIKLTLTTLSTKTSNANLAGSRKWIPHTHTKANKCLHLDSNRRQAPLWATPIGLVIHSKVAAVRRKVALPLRQACVCLKRIWVFLPGRRKEGWPSVRLALCSGSPCELSRLQWAWTILPQASQTGTKLLLNKITMLCPQLP